MANQAIALQARAPQGNFLAPAIQQGAQFINMMSQQRAAERQAAAQQQQLEIARAAEGRAVAGEARAAELHPFTLTKAQADAMTADQKAVIGFYDLTTEGLKRATTPEQAMVVANYLKEKFPGAASAVDQTISTLPSDPGQFEAWRRQTLFQSMSAKEQLGKKFIEQNTGTGTRQLEVSEYEPGAAAQELPGSRIETGQKITYVKGPNGEVIPMPERMAPAAAPAATPRGAPLGPRIEQMVQQLSPGVVVTGRARTPERNAEVGGVPNSLHMTDNARDFRPAAGQSVDDLFKKLSPLKAQGYDVVLEKNKNIVHVEPGPRMGRAPAAGGGVQFGVPVRGTGKAEKVSSEAYNTMEAATAKYDETIARAKRLLSNPALDNIIGNIQGNIPETALSLSSQSAANALSDYNELLAVAGFQELQAMRDASPTGGALGQVSDSENRLLQQSAFASSRTQDEAKFKASLLSYIKRLEDSKRRVEGAYERTFGSRFAPQRAAPAGQPPKGGTPTGVDTNNPLLKG